MTVPLPRIPGPEITRGALLQPPWLAWFDQLYTYITANTSSGGGIIPASRRINTTAPLTGGGDLTADRTLAISVFTALASGIVPASGGGTVNFLRADGSFAVPAYPIGANPTGTIGLSVVNGAAATFMRSDAAPPLSQAITPTWTGAHTYTPTVGTAITINAFAGAFGFAVSGAAGQIAQCVFAGNGNALASGVVIGQGATGVATINQKANSSLLLSTNSTTRITIAAAGAVTIAAPTSGDCLSITNVAGANALTVNGNAAGTAVVRLNTQGTTGANTLTPTWTNFPGGTATKNPDSWIPINVDGTTRYIPVFS